MFNSLDISVSGLVAHRILMDTTQANVANMHTTRDAAGRPNPYQRRFPLFAEADDGISGVRVASIGRDDSVKLVHDPGHADAIQEGPQAGMVRMPDISWPDEMIHAIEARRAYEANMTALEVSKQMYMADLRILA